MQESSPERLHYKRNDGAALPPPRKTYKPKNLSLSLLSTTDVDTDTRHFFSHSLSSCRAVRVNACHITRFASVLVQLVQRVAAPLPLSRASGRSRSVKAQNKRRLIGGEKKTKKQSYRIFLANQQRIRHRQFRKNLLPLFFFVHLPFCCV
jgi:hypothetical protein